MQTSLTSGTDRAMHGQQWTRAEFRSVVVAYRGIVRDESSGVPVDMPERIAELAERLGRKFSAVLLMMQHVSWIMVQRRLPVAVCIPAHAGVGKKAVAVICDVHAELEAEERGDAVQTPWTEPQLKTAIDAYRKAVAIDPARWPVDLPDLVCELGQTAGRRFANARRCLDWIAWLIQERGGRPPVCLAPCGDMPEETRALLERLLDAGRHA